MLRRVARTVCAVALGYTLTLLPGVCSADDKETKPETKPDEKSEAKSPAKDLPPKPDFSNYTRVNDVVGEIVKADDKKLTLRVTWFVPQGGNNNHRPPLHQSTHNYRNPYATNHNRPANTKVNYKEQHHDYVIEFVPESLVRTKVLPPKTDDTGKRVEYTSKELQDLKGPWAIPGYAASNSDLVPGSIVEVVMIRDKSIAAAKVTEDDLRVKYAIILGKDPNPPKDMSKPEPKKKN
jgi:hypothetical protein